MLKKFDLSFYIKIKIIYGNIFANDTAALIPIAVPEF